MSLDVKEAPHLVRQGLESHPGVSGQRVVMTLTPQLRNNGEEHVSTTGVRLMAARGLYVVVVFGSGGELCELLTIMADS